MAVKKKSAEPVAEESVKKVKKVAKAEPAPAPQKKASKKSQEANGEDNTVSLAALCEEIGIDPRAARVRLRKSEFSRDEGARWAWPKGSKELGAVRKFLEQEDVKEAA